MDYDKILQAIIDIGEEMIVTGAEVSRVEDSINRMCRSYGFTKVNVFIITSNMQVTMEDPEGRTHTHIRRIHRYDVNFDKLDYLNDLSRYVCTHPDMTSKEIKAKLKEVMSRPEPKLIYRFIGSVLVAGFFALFFGGTVRDSLAASLMGVIVVLMELLLKDREENQIVYHFIISVVAGIVAILFVKIGLGHNEGIIMMGGIMLLIPGIALTNAIRDMLIGDLASGLLRLVNALLVAGSIACGFAFAIFFMGDIL